MRRRAKEIETGAESLEVHDAKERGRRRDRGRGGPQAQCRADGPDPQRADAAQAQPGRGLRLHELRLAGPGGRPPAHGGVLRERREGGGRGGDQGPGHAGVLRPAQHRRAGRPIRALARSAGPDHPPDDQAAGRHPLRADRLGRGVRAGRRPAERAGPPGRGDLLHLGPHLQRGGVRLPAVRPRVRHQQPARLLQHVPRVDQHRPGRIDRHRQGQRHASRTCTTPS